MPATVSLDHDGALAALAEARARTQQLVAAVSDEQLERVHSTLMSPLVWDLGHIAAFEDLWLVHRYGRRPLLREGLAEIYDAFETPRAHRGELDFLGPDEAREYLAEVRARTLEVIDQRDVGDGTVFEMVLRHEHQHNETMLQTMQLAHLPLSDTGTGGAGAEVADSTAEADSTAVADSTALTGLETVAVAAGESEIGAAADGFAYDNERPRHRISLPAFAIGRVPVTNGAFAEFVAGGGYGRREWWSSEGWRWRSRESASRPLHWSEDLAAEWRLGERVALHPSRPVVHVSWFEADAFARSHGARLPTEAEWERAATADARRDHPWGHTPPVPGVHANVDQMSGGPVPVGSLPAGASPLGCEQLIGDVWEWTASEFDGYPGFRAFPYPQYSEVFFGAGYRVLRGGSWATRPRVATAAFRNWDLPERRQIFAGLRIARDL